MRRDQALPYVSFALDDALNPSPATAEALRSGKIEGLDPSVRRARLVGWQCGFEPLFVAVFSYLPDCSVDSDTAEEIAKDYLAERNWFGDEGPRDADYVL